MTFTDGKKYTVRKLSSSHRNWSAVQEAVDRKINHREKKRVGNLKLVELYSVRWRKKPFTFPYREFKLGRRFFFHGTYKQTIQRILDEGFRVLPSGRAMHGRMLGDGIYITFHTNKGIAYASENYVLSVMVYAPNVYVVHPGQRISEKQIGNLARKYHAIEVRTGAIIDYPGRSPWTMKNHEICVFDTQRVIPRFILKLG